MSPAPSEVNGQGNTSICITHPLRCVSPGGCPTIVSDNPARDTTNRKAVCGKTALTVWREGSPAQPDFPTPIDASGDDRYDASGDGALGTSGPKGGERVRYSAANSLSAQGSKMGYAASGVTQPTR